MYVTPEIAFYIGTVPVYKCKCGERFQQFDLLKNKKIKGTRDYCPKCKNKLHLCH